jgi:chemotaxis family two-component system response regulator Rcp1
MSIRKRLELHYFGPEKALTFQPTLEILLIENDPTDVRLALEALKESKRRIHVAVIEDGQEALNYLAFRDQYMHAPRPDLILLDLNLPSKNAFEVLTEIRKNPRLNQVAVAILSRSLLEKDRLKAQSLQIVHFLNKPLKLEELPLNLNL